MAVAIRSPEISSDEMRKRIKTGAINDFDNLIVYIDQPQEGEKRWQLLHTSDLAELPADIVPNYPMKDSTRTFPFELNVGGEAKELYIFCKVETGWKSAEVKKEVLKGPEAFHTQMAAAYQCSSLEAYKLTVAEFRDPLFKGYTFVRRKATTMQPVDNSSQPNISAPSDSDGEVHFTLPTGGANQVVLGEIPPGSQVLKLLDANGRALTDEEAAACLSGQMNYQYITPGTPNDIPTLDLTQPESLFFSQSQPVQSSHDQGQLLNPVVIAPQESVPQVILADGDGVVSAKGPLTDQTNLPIRAVPMRTRKQSKSPAPPAESGKDGGSGGQAGSGGNAGQQAAGTSGGGSGSGKDGDDGEEDRRKKDPKRTRSPTPPPEDEEEENKDDEDGEKAVTPTKRRRGKGAPPSSGKGKSSARSRSKSATSSRQDSTATRTGTTSTEKGTAASTTSPVDPQPGPSYRKTASEEAADNAARQHNATERDLAMMRRRMENAKQKGIWQQQLEATGAEDIGQLEDDEERDKNYEPEGEDESSGESEVADDDVEEVMKTQVTAHQPKPHRRESQKKNTVRNKNKADDVELAEAGNEKVGGARCGDHCNCREMSVSELRDASCSMAEHRDQLMKVRLHNSNMASHRATRSRMSDYTGLLKAILENQADMKEKIYFLFERAKAMELTGDDSNKIEIPWSSSQAVVNGLNSEDKEKAFTRLMVCPVLAPDKTHFVAQMIDAVFTPEFRGRAYLRKPAGFGQDMVVFWGHEFYPLPKKFGALMLAAIMKRFKLGEGVVKDKVYNGLGEARTKVRCEMRNNVLRRRREPNAHEIWELLLKDELMKFSKFARVINLPAPFEQGDEELTRYCNIFRDEIDRKYPDYQMWLKNQKKRKEQTEFEHLLEFGVSRGFGHDWQPRAADEEYDPEAPPPPQSVHGLRLAAEKAKKAAAKEAGLKSPKKKKKKQASQFDLEVDLEALEGKFSDEEKENDDDDDDRDK